MRLAARWIGIACIAGALVFLVLEAALRLFWPEFFPHHVPGLFAPHPELGHVLAPDRETHIVKPEYQLTTRTNAAGFRGAELSPKTGTTVRILCLGDWLTWGEGVEDHETYPILLEAALRQRYPGRHVQLINAGVPQYGTLDEFLYLESIARGLEPDFLIIQFYAGDDFDQNDVPSRDRHVFIGDTLDQTASFTASTGPRWLTVLKWLKHRSHLVHFVSERVGQAVMRANLLADLEQASSTHFSDEQARLTRELLAKMAAVGEEVGARTLFVFAPEKMQVLPRLEPPLRAAGVVAAVAETTGSAFLDLTPRMVEHEEVERLFLNSVGTWRPETYRLAADAIAKEIIALGWIVE